MEKGEKAAKNELTESKLPGERHHLEPEGEDKRGKKQRSRYWSVSYTRKPESDHNKRTKSFDNAREQRAV